MVKPSVCLSPGLGMQAQHLARLGPGLKQLDLRRRGRRWQPCASGCASGALVPVAAGSRGRLLRQSGHLLRHVIQPVRHQLDVPVRVVLFEALQCGLRLLVFGLGRGGACRSCSNRRPAESGRRSADTGRPPRPPAPGHNPSSNARTSSPESHFNFARICFLASGTE